MSNENVSDEITDLIDIPLHAIHKCDGMCPKFVDVTMSDGTPCKKFVESKCDRNGITENASIYIVGYTSGEFSEAEYSASGCKSPILGGDEIVIRDEQIKIEFSYPLSKTIRVTFKSTSGFTRKHLVGLIVESYRHIYAEEEKSIKNKPVIPESERGRCLNRNTTDGIYGIWGHDIGDLWIEGIHYRRGSHTVVLDIGS